MPQESPSHVWKSIVPSVVSAVKFGAMSPSRSAIGRDVLRFVWGGRLRRRRVLAMLRRDPGETQTHARVAHTPDRASPADSGQEHLQGDRREDDRETQAHDLHRGPVLIHEPKSTPGIDPINRFSSSP